MVKLLSDVGQSFTRHWLPKLLTVHIVHTPLSMVKSLNSKWVNGRIDWLAPAQGGLPRAH